MKTLLTGPSSRSGHHPGSRQDPPRPHRHTGDLSSSTMRASTIAMFIRWIGAAGVGSALGAATGGLATLLTGQLISPSSWLAGSPVLAILGACFGLAVARLSRRWLTPHMSRRALWFTVAGLVTVPLAFASGKPPLSTVTIVLMAVGGITTWTVYLRALRQFAARHHVPVARIR